MSVALRNDILGAPTTIYACHLELADYLVDRSGKAFDREEYRAHPERFDSVFHEKVRSSLPSLIAELTFSLPDCTLLDGLPQRRILGAAFASPSHDGTARVTSAKLEEPAHLYC